MLWVMEHLPIHAVNSTGKFFLNDINRIDVFRNKYSQEILWLLL